MASLGLLSPCAKTHGYTTLSSQSKVKELPNNFCKTNLLIKTIHLEL